MNRSLLLGGNGAPGLLVALGALGILLALFWASGVLVPDESYSSEDALRMTGMSLMLTLMPAYLLAAWSLGLKRSLELVEGVRPLLPRPSAADGARDAIGNALRTTWPWGCLAGLVLGLMNAQPFELFRESEQLLVEATLSLGQLVMWTTIGVVLGVSYARARAFRGLGELVDFDLFALDRLRPLALAGIVDVAIVAGAVLFTPLQSLDAEFRWFNYHFAVIVALPVSAFLLFWPLLPLHRRLLADRNERVAAIDAQLAEGELAKADLESIRNLELLLAHRDRLRDAHTWPLSLRLLSRVLFYLVIPPLAWAGAALVELGVEAVLGGSGL